jgi:hypothetical protein
VPPLVVPRVVCPVRLLRHRRMDPVWRRSTSRCRYGVQVGRGDMDKDMGTEQSKEIEAVAVDSGRASAIFMYKLVPLVG